MAVTYEELKTIISEKPSLALRHALDALDTFTATPNCKINMNVYHDYSADTCFACLGGAATIVRLDVPADELWVPES